MSAAQGGQTFACGVDAAGNLMVRTLPEMTQDDAELAVMIYRQLTDRWQKKADVECRRAAKALTASRREYADQIQDIADRHSETADFLEALLQRGHFAAMASDLRA